ncbi:MAG: hypothetical protein R3C16_06700 [Hyphomonadaceae bacterium]
MRAIATFLRRHALVRLFLTHTAIGYGVSTLFVAAILLLDLGGLASLIASQHAETVVLLLWFFIGLTFASVQMGMAIMSLGDEAPPGGGKRQRTPLLAPVRIKASEG